MKAVREALENLKCRPEGHSAPLTIAVLEAMAAELEKKPKAAPVERKAKPKSKK